MKFATFTRTGQSLATAGFLVCATAFATPFATAEEPDAFQACRDKGFDFATCCRNHPVNGTLTITQFGEACSYKPPTSPKPITATHTKPPAPQQVPQPGQSQPPPPPKPAGPIQPAAPAGRG
jgi:hypothetical protein